MASTDGATAPNPSDQAPKETIEMKEDENLAEISKAEEAEKTLAPLDEEKEQGVGANGDSSDRKEDGFTGSEPEEFSTTVARAAELYEKGSKAIEDGDFVEAVDCLSRCLEIRTAHYGELAPECSLSYYKYGCALLYKSQDEADPLGNVPKNTARNSENDVALKEGSGSSKASSSDAKQDNTSSTSEGGGEGAADKDQEDDNEGSDGDGEELTEADEDDSDLDLAWKMLDIARAIVEKIPCETMEQVNILAALGEVSMEREDFETSLNDYLKALSILEHLVEPDNRRIVELNFRICLVLEVGSKPEEAIPYCEKTISLCKSRLKRLSEGVHPAVLPENANPVTDSDTGGNQTSGKGGADNSALGEDEKEVLSGILSELERKLEDLQQVMSNPKSIYSEIMKMVASKSASGGINLPVLEARASDSSQMAVVNGGFDSPTVSTGATNGVVTHLGVVGRGVKRASLNPIGETSPKKQSLDSSAADGDGSSISEVASTT